MTERLPGVAVAEGVKLKISALIPRNKVSSTATFDMLALVKIRDLVGKVMVFTVVTPGDWATAEVMYAYDEKPRLH